MSLLWDDIGTRIVDGLEIDHLIALITLRCLACPDPGRYFQTEANEPYANVHKTKGLVGQKIMNVGLWEDGYKRTTGMIGLETHENARRNHAEITTK